MNKRSCLFLLSVLLFSSGNVNAAFPDDLDDVVFIEEGGVPGLAVTMRNMAVTANLFVSFSSDGEQIILDSDKRNIWPAGSGTWNCCNANAWLFVKVGETWYAGTWEYLRVGQTTKLTRSLAGPQYLRFPPLQNFAPQIGEIYGYMVAGITRPGLAFLSINERSNVFFHKFGVGPVDECEAVPESLNCEPKISIVIDPASVSEIDGAGATTATVYRNSDTTSALTVTLVSNDTTEATVPSTVSIAAGQRFSDPFNIDAIDDDLIDGTQTVTITASANAHVDGTDMLDVTDDESVLTVQIATASVGEEVGEAATTATVSRNTDTSSELMVTLASDDTSEMTAPLTVTIAAGQSTSPAFNLDAVDDSIVDGTQTVTLTASATAHSSGTDTLEVTDDDVAEITMVIDADSVNESDGPIATFATVLRNTDTSSELTVMLTSDDTTEATIPAASVNITAGQSNSPAFNIDAIQDGLVDGMQTVTLTASAAGHADGIDTLVVIDDDVPEITIMIDLASVSESDGVGATTAIVSRNTDTSLALAVTLASSDTTEATVPAVVLIAAGQRSSDPFNIDVINDAVIDGTQTVTVTASAFAHADAIDTLDVTDVGIDDESPFFVVPLPTGGAVIFSL